MSEWLSLLLLIAPIMLLVVLMMAIGVIMGRKPLKGSCGGMSALSGQQDCPVCGGNPDKCDASDTAAPPARTVKPEVYDAFRHPDRPG